MFIFDRQNSNKRIFIFLSQKSIKKIIKISNVKNRWTLWQNRKYLSHNFGNFFNFLFFHLNYKNLTDCELFTLRFFVFCFQITLIIIFLKEDLTFIFKHLQQYLITTRNSFHLLFISFDFCLIEVKLLNNKHLSLIS